MQSRSLVAVCVLGCLAQSYACAQNKSATGAFLPGQAAADLVKNAAHADGAFLASALLKDSYQSDNLASMLQYPADEVVILKLKGSEIRAAFERSASLYPQENTSFLQISGFVVEASGKGDPGKRILNVTVDGADLDENRVYTVAMPSSLGRGGLGYFKIWDKSKIADTLTGTTMESLLKGKKYVETKSRWSWR